MSSNHTGVTSSAGGDGERAGMTAAAATAKELGTGVLQRDACGRGGHAPQIEAPRATTRIIDRFVYSLDPAG